MRHNGKSLCAAARKHAAPGTCRCQPSCPTSAPSNGKQVFLRTCRCATGACMSISSLCISFARSARKKGTKAHVKTSQWAMPKTCLKPKRSYGRDIASCREDHKNGVCPTRDACGTARGSLPTDSKGRSMAARDDAEARHGIRSHWQLKRLLAPCSHTPRTTRSQATCCHERRACMHNHQGSLCVLPTHA